MAKAPKPVKSNKKVPSAKKLGKEQSPVVRMLRRVL
jgi:hypothetical protein